MSERLPTNGIKSTNVRTFYWHLVPLRVLFRVLGAIAPGLTGKIALRLFRTPRRHDTPTRELEWTEGAQRFEIDARGESLAGWSWGSGPAVLLMHGWEGRATQMGAFVEPLVTAGYRVIAVDAPGHGRSTGRQSSVPQFAAAVEAVAKQHGPLAAIVAHSFGAAASAWAMRFGLRVPKMVFVAPPANLDEYISFFGDLLDLSDRVRTEMVARLESRFDVRWSDIRVATLSPTPGVALLVIHDQGDRDSSIDNGRAVAAAWPEAELMVTSGLGHRRILRAPEVIDQVMGFVAGDGKAHPKEFPMTSSPSGSLPGSLQGQRLPEITSVQSGASR